MAQRHRQGPPARPLCQLRAGPVGDTGHTQPGAWWQVAFGPQEPKAPGPEAEHGDGAPAQWIHHYVTTRPWGVGGGLGTGAGSLPPALLGGGI